MLRAAALLVLLFALWALPAHAQDLVSARIETLSHVDRAGRWRVVAQSDQGSVLRAGAATEELLVRGAALNPGDHVSTRGARVQLLLSDGSRLNIAEDSELTLQSGEAGRWARLR